MNEFLWYSRFILWVGALVLLIEALTGRSSGPITVIAVLCLFGGLIAFVIALSLSGIRSSRPPIERHPDAGDGEEEAAG
ncbi:MAG: hypothetical protein M3Z66_02520 [Chloroflexota bacterium]|nr:hypothetical protein [Chloroflexota bacterium]